MADLSDLPVAVIGAGPKAAALAAKRMALVENNFSCPPIVIIEQHKPAAHWTGEYGFTDGEQSLGTPPEKDVGFPYWTLFEGDKGHSIARFMYSNFSWCSFITFEMSERAYYADWLDRGRPPPTHKHWAQYIAWVIKKAEAKTIIGTVRHLEEAPHGWRIHITTSQGRSYTMDCCGVVVTGPGTPRHAEIRVASGCPRILNGQDYWSNWSMLRDTDKIKPLSAAREPGDPVVVVGGGETAASIASHMVGLRSDVEVRIITRSGTIFSRGEGYYENRMFRDTDTWRELPERVRREVINRGDRGVFSPNAVQKLARAANVIHQSAEIESIAPNTYGTVVLTTKSRQTIEAQLVVTALGFDPFWFAELFPEAGKKAILADKAAVEATIENDLSIKKSFLRQKCHVPMIAGVAQGPGFPNLSCLGNLSDAILKQYYRKK